MADKSERVLGTADRVMGLVTLTVFVALTYFGLALQQAGLSAP